MDPTERERDSWIGAAPWPRHGPVDQELPGANEYLAA